MAVASSTIWEVRTTGASINGGGYNPVTGIHDYSQQASAQYSTSAATSSGAGNTVLWAAAAADMVGNIAQCSNGTNFNKGFFEVLSVSVGVSVTFSTDKSGTSICSGVGASGVINVGGAFKFGNTSYPDFTGFAPAIQPGNTVWIKNDGTVHSAYVLTFSAATVNLPVLISGYQTTRGDNPTGNNRPVLTAQNTTSFSTYYTVKNIIGDSLTNTVTGIFSTGTHSTLINCKAVNRYSSGSYAIGFSQDGLLINCEAACFSSDAISIGAQNCMAMGCYFHDSNIGIGISSASASCQITDCIIESCTTAAIQLDTGAATLRQNIVGNTLYGSENRAGIGINISLTGIGDLNISNNIIYGFSVGIYQVDTVTNNYGDCNDFYNNSSDVTNWVKGPNDQSLNPNFTSVAQITGASGHISSNVLTDSGANFSSVVDNQDCIYLISGSGITAGVYLITNHTTTTLTLHEAPGGSGTNIAYQLTTLRNFAIGTNLSGLGFPGTFPASRTVGYLDIGAVKRKVDVPATTDVRSTIVYDDGTKTGTAAIPSASNVRFGTAVDATTGTCYVPVAGNVLTTIPVDNTTGSLAIPTVSQIAAAVWDYLTSSFSATGSIGLLLGTNVDAATSSRLASSSYSAPDNSDIAAIKAKTDNLPASPADESLVIDATNAIFSRLGTPSGASMSADIAAVKTDVDALPDAAAITDAVWDEPIVDHLTAGTTGNALSTASTGDVDANTLAAAVWNEAMSTHTTSGTFGWFVQKLLTFNKFLGLK